MPISASRFSPALICFSISLRRLAEVDQCRLQALRGFFQLGYAFFELCRLICRQLHAGGDVLQFRTDLVALGAQFECRIRCRAGTTRSPVWAGAVGNAPVVSPAAGTDVVGVSAC